MDIDIVLPYVDMSRDEWKKLYNETNEKLGRCRSEDSRFRQLIDLKYLLRCIDKYCNFVRTVYLVVQSRDQVPDYVYESSRLKVIEHKDIIPAEFLPTFNSNTIDLHIHRIPGLSEHFIYINDDMYPVNYLSETDFFTEDGKPKINLRVKQQTINTFRTFLKNSEIFIRNVLGIKERIADDEFLRDGHSWTPMIKSHWKRLYNLNNVIRNSCTPFRDRKNLTQQVSTYYEYFTNNLEPRTIRTKYWDFRQKTDLVEFLDGSYDIVCVNDSGLEGDIELKMQSLEGRFSDIVPDKSERYEK